MSEERPLASGGLAGSRVAGYLCEEEICRGGMAVVYRAFDERLGRRVALKVLAPRLAADEEFRERFMRESRIAAATEHPHIIPVFDAGEADGALFIVMRYVPDGDVRMLIDRAGPLPAAHACALVHQAALALDAAHARGLVHRDVKPTNMLLELAARPGEPDYLYLSDFGLAKPSAAAGLTSTGQFFGTVGYVAPEQIQGHPLDGRADQYSLACSCFEMLCGSPPFARENGMAVVWAHLSEPPPSLAARRPGLPPAVDQVIARALAKSPSDRFGCCLDFAGALARACGATPPGPQPSAGSPGPPTATAALFPPGPPPAAPPPSAAAPTTPLPGAPPPAYQPQPAVAGWHAGQPRPVTTRDQHGGRPRQRRSRRGAAAVIAALAVLLIGAAAASYLVSNRPGGPSHVAGSSPPSASPARRARPAGPPGPAATVRAYFSAINSHDYRRAWRLGGRNSASASYRSFASGFAHTAHDTVTIVSVSGNVVTARLVARQADGTIRVFNGTYTVSNGVITAFDVH